MNDLDNELRDLFATRADDVHAEPGLFAEVQRRRARGRVRTGALIGAGAVAAAAVIAGGITVLQPPPRVEIGPVTGPDDGLVEPTDGPTDATDNPAGEATEPTEPSVRGSDVVMIDGVPLPSFAVRTDGAVIEIVDLAWDLPGGNRSYTVAQVADLGADDSDASYISVHVRPGSTSQRTDWLTLVFTDNRYVLEHMWREGSDFGSSSLPARFQPRTNGEADGATPTPVWSPDGTSFAFLDDGGLSGPISLRVTGWNDGAGTGNTATDNAEWAIEDVGFLTLQDWRWDQDTLVTGGTLLGVQPGDVFTSIRIERQADGAIAYTETLSGGGGPVTALEDTERSDLSGVFRLERPESALTLVHSGEDATGAFESFVDIVDPAPPTSVRLQSHAGASVVSTNTQTWFVTVAIDGDGNRVLVKHDDRTLAGSWSYDWIS